MFPDLFHKKDSQKLTKLGGHRLRSSVIKHGPELWGKLFSLPLHRRWYYIDIPKVDISMALSWALLFSSWVVAETLCKAASCPADADTLGPKAEKSGVGPMRWQYLAALFVCTRKTPPRDFHK